ncbi:hypothetical protein c7_R43 [Megavirus courdo7]|uniref:Uncharacterized protein n=1 Tax=Megavirus courdo7 TaxID=1128135 RepID=H2E9N6_9VIRU|nr:hypothetical protein c7_R43 [Megavirus courdo7]
MRKQIIHKKTHANDDVKSKNNELVKNNIIGLTTFFVLEPPFACLWSEYIIRVFYYL